MTPKLSQNQMSKLKEVLFNYVSRPQNSFGTVLRPLKKQIGAQKSKKMTPKLSQNQKLEFKKI